MADFDTALQRQHALAVWRRVTHHDIANIGDEIGLGKIATPIHAGVMEVDFICTGDKITHVGDRAVGHDAQFFLAGERAQVAGWASKIVNDFCFAGKTEAAVEPVHFARLDFIQCVVTPDQEQPDFRSSRIAAGVGFIRGEYD